MGNKDIDNKLGRSDVLDNTRKETETDKKFPLKSETGSTKKNYKQRGGGGGASGRGGFNRKSNKTADLDNDNKTKDTTSATTSATTSTTTTSSSMDNTEDEQGRSHSRFNKQSGAQNKKSKGLYEKTPASGENRGDGYVTNTSVHIEVPVVSKWKGRFKFNKGITSSGAEKSDEKSADETSASVSSSASSTVSTSATKDVRDTRGDVEKVDKKTLSSPKKKRGLKDRRTDNKETKEKDTVKEVKDGKDSKDSKDDKEVKDVKEVREVKNVKSGKNRGKMRKNKFDREPKITNEQQVSKDHDENVSKKEQDTSLELEKAKIIPETHPKVTTTTPFSTRGGRGLSSRGRGSARRGSTGRRSSRGESSRDILGRESVISPPKDSHHSNYHQDVNKDFSAGSAKCPYINSRKNDSFAEVVKQDNSAAASSSNGKNKSESSNTAQILERQESEIHTHENVSKFSPVKKNFATSNRRQSFGKKINRNDQIQHSAGHTMGGFHENNNTTVVVNQEDHKIRNESRFFKTSSLDPAKNPQAGEGRTHYNEIHYNPSFSHHNHHNTHINQQQPFSHNHPSSHYYHHQPQKLQHFNNNLETNMQDFYNVGHQQQRELGHNVNYHSQKPVIMRRRSSHSSVFNNAVMRDEFQHSSYQKAAESVIEDEYDDTLLESSVSKNINDKEHKRKLSNVLSSETKDHNEIESKIEKSTEQVLNDVGQSNQKPTVEESKPIRFSLDDLLKPGFLTDENVWNEEGIDLSKINENVEQPSAKPKTQYSEENKDLYTNNGHQQQQSINNSRFVDEHSQMFSPSPPKIEFVEREQQRPKEDQGPPYVVKISKLQSAFNLNKIENLILRAHAVEYVKFKIFWDMNIDGSLNYKSKVCFFEVTSFNEMVKIISKLSANKYNYILSKAALPDFRWYMEKNHPSSVADNYKDPNEYCEGEIVLYDPITRKPITESQANEAKVALPNKTNATFANGSGSAPASTPTTPMFSFAEIATKAALAASSGNQKSPSPILAAKGISSSGSLNPSATAKLSPLSNQTSLYSGPGSTVYKPNPITSRLSSPSPSSVTSSATGLNSPVNASGNSSQRVGRTFSSKNPGTYPSRDRERDRDRERGSQSPTKSFGLACSFITGNISSNGQSSGNYRKYR